MSENAAGKEEWLDRPRAIREGEELDLEKLAAFLEENVAGFKGPVEALQFPSGHSNLTYMIRGGGREMALRRPPFGAKGIKKGHDMGREWRVLSGLAKVWDKVPEPIAFCEDESVIGAPFYVMERVNGVILRGANPKGPELTEDLMSRLSEGLVDALAEVHRLDVDAAGLSDFGKPEGYVRRQIEGWTERYRNAQTDNVANMDAAAEWLAANMPAEAGAALIHGDFKYDNLALDPNDLTRVVAVLDWEMAALGDPLTDLGVTLAYWVEAADPQPMQMLKLLPTSLPGNLTRAQIVDRYIRKSGCEPFDPVYYYVYGLFKVAVIAQQIYFRFKKGFTKDPRFGALIGAVYLLSEAASKAIGKGRIYDLG